jgi:hypothetical protein
MWKFLVNRTLWDIAIADHADPGRVARSMLLPFGSRRRAGHCRRGACCNVPKDGSQSAEVLQEMRWPSYDQSSSARIGGRVCGDVTDVEVHCRCPRQLCRNSFAYARRTSQAEGFSQRVWRLRRSRAGVRRARPQECPLVARGGHADSGPRCLLSGAKRTSSLPRPKP